MITAEPWPVLSDGLVRSLVGLEKPGCEGTDPTLGPGAGCSPGRITEPGLAAFLGCGQVRHGSGRAIHPEGGREMF